MKLSDTLWTTGLHLSLGETEDKYSIALSLANNTRDRFLVSLPGSMLEPEDPVYQRLFVAGAHDSASQFWVPAGGEKVVRLATVCMDERLRDPVLGLRFQVSYDQGPRGLIKSALRWEREKEVSCGDDLHFVGRDPQSPWGLKDLELVAHGKVTTR